jgi:hypothetical protein
MSCAVPSQEFFNGFCYDKCEPGWTAVADVCLANCPVGFTTRGEACEPETILRNPVRTYFEPCQENEIDINGSCYQPQKVISTRNASGEQVRVSGCGCITKTLDQRIQCPDGFVRYNNGCLTKCPEGYSDILDKNGKIISLYCTKECPLKPGSKDTRWPYIGGLCVRPWKTRLASTVTEATLFDTENDASVRAIRPAYGLPQTMASYLASKPLGSSLQDRYRAGISIYKNLDSNPDTSSLLGAIGTKTATTFEKYLIYFIVIIVVLAFFLPSILPYLGRAFGSVLEGFGVLAGKVEQGAGSVIAGVGSGAGAIAAATGQAAASVEKAVGSNVAAAIESRASRLQAENVARPIEAAATATQQLISAEEALKNVKAQTETNTLFNEIYDLYRESKN